MTKGRSHLGVGGGNPQPGVRGKPREGDVRGGASREWSLQGPLARVAAAAGAVSSPNLPVSSKEVQILDRFWANSFDLPY
jgi:hypothetical protein